MKCNELKVRFCGIAGDGVVTAGRILAETCVDIGLNVMLNDIYSAEIRGNGKGTTTVRFSTKKIRSMGDGIDVLVAMAGKESISELDDIQKDGSVIYSSDLLGKITEKRKSSCTHTSLYSWIWNTT